MEKSYKYNSMQTLVHIDYHQLPKSHMGLHALSKDHGANKITQKGYVDL
jgi:hypothetical protein